MILINSCMSENEPHKEKTNNVVSKQVSYKPSFTVTENSYKPEISGKLESRGTILYIERKQRR